MSCRRKRINARQMRGILKRNGFTYVSCKGDHEKYERGTEQVVITKDLNAMVALRLCKEHRLVV